MVGDVGRGLRNLPVAAQGEQEADRLDCADVLDRLPVTAGQVDRIRLGQVRLDIRHAAASGMPIFATRCIGKQKWGYNQLYDIDQSFRLWCLDRPRRPFRELCNLSDCACN
jgi:hypothetical protein